MVSSYHTDIFLFITILFEEASSPRASSPPCFGVMKNVGQCGAPIQFLPIFLNLETTVCRKPYFYYNKSIQNSSINLLETFMIKCLLGTTPSEKGPLINIKIVFS